LARPCTDRIRNNKIPNSKRRKQKRKQKRKQRKKRRKKKRRNDMFIRILI
jgi:hypothetical protein